MAEDLANFAKDAKIMGYSKVHVGNLPYLP